MSRLVLLLVLLTTTVTLSSAQRGDPLSNSALNAASLSGVMIVLSQDEPKAPHDDVSDDPLIKSPATAPSLLPTRFGRGYRH